MPSKKKQKSIRDLNCPPITDDLPGDGEDSSKHVHQRDKLKRELKLRMPYKMTDTQNKFIEMAMDKQTKLMFISGPAGSSKTILSVYVALKLLDMGRVSDLIYTRSPVESADSKLGYLPGDKDDKMSPYIQPLIDKLEELLPTPDIQFLKGDNRIQSVHVGFSRGLNWNVKAVIADECQNMTAKELITLITRIGEFSKVFILGDPMQSDLNGKSGFMKLFNLFNDSDSSANGIRCFEFTEEDIVRSELVKFIIKKLKTMDR